MTLRAMGIGRDPQDERTLFVIFDRCPTDDEMRAVHDALRGERTGADGDDGRDRPFAPPEAYADEAAGAPRRNYAAECAMKCGEPGFLAFLGERHGLERPLTPERAAVRVRSLIGITSRRELNDDARAAAAWRQLVREYDRWRKAS